MIQEQILMTVIVYPIFLGVLTLKHVTMMIQQTLMMVRVFMLKLITIVTENA